MTRIYSGNNSVIPGWYDGPNALKIFYNGSYKPATGQCYQLKDTNWHTYIWEFNRGSATGTDGVIRLWVDNILVYEDAHVNWSDTGTVFKYDYFPVMQGNMSGNYNGGELYTYWDDYVWATTLGEVEAFLGVAVGQPDTTPPAVPGGTKVQVR